MEITNGIFQAANNIYQNNKGSLVRTIIYTIGHFAIAITVLMLVADVSFAIALTDAIVEPIAGVIGALAVTFFTPLLPYALAFAAGAMIFVVVEEVIPETQLDKYTDIATLGFIGGFIIMMTLDVALG